MLGNSISSWRVGTLGGPGTFAGQATQVAVERYKEIGAVCYYPTMDAVWAAIASGEVDAGILTGETTHTGFVETGAKLLNPESAFFVAGEVIVPYHCMLLGKPGTTLEQITHIVGHGSLRQCQRFLREKLPSVQVKMHEQNSLAAAREVLEGDGTTAVVGTRRSAEESGLSIIAPDVDEGSEGTWWLFTRRLHVSPDPDVVVVGVRSDNRDTLRKLFVRMQAFALTPRGLATVSQGILFGYAHLVVLTGRPLPVAAQDLLEGLDGCWLAGAFSSTASQLPALHPSQPAS